ncbi:hypothetical protein [Dysgonomonas sp. 25]|uniref:hypothetical protein n=1 Tax=Dysgonomonas sp. 25 TaxID=2302933 RepID=UPI0013D8A09D|nr:hypothetical protein [Dysgonomonas sp. 25]NDV68558.1 hypothetical protein [Dysgonomonas sp. 25]
MSLSTNIKQAIKEAILEIIAEVMSEYIKGQPQRKGKNIDPDLISTRQAYKLRGRSRVTHLINLGLLKQINTGTNATSVKYISKKKLISLDKVNI